MQRIPLMQRYRNATWKTWLGAALVVWLLLAESFALAHQYSLGHANSPDCAVCVGAASFGAAAVSVPVRFEPVAAAPFVVTVAGAVLFSVVPARRYARGPPAGSFTF
jgi:hypothetical protein